MGFWRLLETGLITLQGVVAPTASAFFCPERFAKMTNKANRTTPANATATANKRSRIGKSLENFILDNFRKFRSFNTPDEWATILSTLIKEPAPKKEITPIDKIRNEIFDQTENHPLDRCKFNYKQVDQCISNSFDLGCQASLCEFLGFYIKVYPEDIDNIKRIINIAGFLCEDKQIHKLWMRRVIDKLY